jgi:hypothetical protein
MTHLALHLLNSPPMDFFAVNGMWIFLAVGAIALFGIFLPTATWMDHRHKEREAYYKAETLRRISEAPGDGSKAAVQLLREEERMKAIKAREGLKIAGVINIGVGLGLVIFLRSMLGPYNSAYLSGLIPGFIGIAMIVYVYLMAPPVDHTF